jgi:hypothetical protein
LEELGPNACGAWTCDAFGECVVASDACSDRDEDGYGVGTSCTCSLDCDDNDADVTTSLVTPCCRTGSGTKTCTNGVWGVCSAGTPASAEACDGEDDDCDGVADNDIGDVSCGLGACRVTLPACVGGSVSTCLPLPPTSAVDGCNEVDDDCDGAVDEDCTACLHVAPDGDDAAAASSGGIAPFRNVQPAIDYAAAHPEGPTRVCVAAGVACGDTATYAGPSGADLRMRNGIDLLGGYESTGWTRCSNSTTGLHPGTGLGVLFDEDVVEPTVLDGFAIDRFAAADTAGVSVRGAAGVMLSNLRIVDGPPATTSYGVNVTEGGVATVTRSEIDGGRAAEQGAGVRSMGARLHLTENCPTPLDPVTGHCVDAAFIWPTVSCPSARIRGVARNGPSPRSRAVELESSPGSRIESSSLCGTSNGNVAVRIVGDARSIVVRGNTIRGLAAAVDMLDCAAAAPRIIDNHSLAGRITAISSSGNCHPVIETNREVVAGQTPVGAQGGLKDSAILCNGSRCVIVANQSIRRELHRESGTSFFSAATAAITCWGGCAKIAHNTIVGLKVLSSPYQCRSCQYFATGLDLYGTWEALVDGNSIVPADLGSNLIGDLFLTGIEARQCHELRIHNNVVSRSINGYQTRRLRSFGLRVDGGVIDVHSNSFDSTVEVGQIPDQIQDGCEMAGIFFNGATRSVFRNNRLQSPSCPVAVAGRRGSYSFVENREEADPTVFENNGGHSYLCPACAPAFFYLDEGLIYDQSSGTGLSVPQTNALTDMIVSGNVAGCTPSTPLSANSPCTNAGTPVGAPLYDYEGQLRDAMPDIGHDEL